MEDVNTSFIYNLNQAQHCSKIIGRMFKTTLSLFGFTLHFLVQEQMAMLTIPRPF
jgi:hypothetical protein